MRLRRRDLFGFGGGLGVAAGLASASHWWHRTRVEPSAVNANASADCAQEAQAGAYGERYMPPDEIRAGHLEACHTPPPRRQTADLLSVTWPVIETSLEVARGQRLNTWAYNGTVPGPVLRATVGERVQVRIDNRTARPHNLHFHGSHDVNADGLERIAPGTSREYAFEAGPFGLHPYHCHVPPYAWHIGRGLYGAFIVDPPGGRPPAHEYVLVLGGFDTDGDGVNDVYAWNGIAGYYARYPLKVPVGERVRLYIVNMVELDPLAGFHLHAQTFDLFRSGTSLTPHEHTDVVTLGPAERAIVEFTLPRRGRYMFHPHQSRMTERGAMGFIVAV
ncbi:MAG: multicopper oxidase domain-containing protein [Pseudomonadota bacterium]